MSKHFRPWNIDQTLLLPPSVQDFVPKDHVSRFIVGLVRESLDFKEIAGSYVSGLGQPPFDPRMMVALLLHGYASGLYSSRRIARACRERNDFVMIVALDPPDFRTISDFRKRHLKALGALFLQVLKLCEAAVLPAVRIRAYSAEKLRLLCGGPSPLVVECSRVASPINAGLRPPPTAADGIDRGCHTAAICLQEVDGKVRSAYPPNFMPENFAAPSLRGS